MSLIPVLFNLPLVLFPVQIVFLELIIDPACSIVFESEKEEANVMTRPPRQREEGLFTRETLVISLLQGAVVLAVVLIVYLTALSRGLAEPEVRSLTFTTIVIANLGLIFTNRSWSETAVQSLRSPNKALWWVVGGTLCALFLVLYVPVLQGLFWFAPVPPLYLLACAGAGIISILWFEIFKYWRKKSIRN
jgi:Ca2+-transporting ATPase